MTNEQETTNWLANEPSEEEKLANINAAAEIAASRTDKYYIPVSDLLKGVAPLPKELCFEDRVERFVWLERLEEHKLKVDKQPISDARTEELKKLDLAIVDINKQLNHLKRISKQKLREKVLQQLIDEDGLDELEPLGQLGVWQKLTEIDPKLFPKREKKDSTIKKFYGKQNLIKFRQGVKSTEI